MGIIDRLLSTVSPGRAAKRETARLKKTGATLARMVYEGATVSRRSQGWRAVSTDGNTEIGVASQRLRDVARDMCRNNAYAKRAKQVITHNVVGTGIIPTVKGGTARQRQQLEALLKAQFDTTACDVFGRHDLYGIQALVMATVVESGECIVRYRSRRPEDNLPVAFQFQVMEPDFLDTSKDTTYPSGAKIVQGIEYDPLDRIVAYYLFDRHPGSMSASGATLTSTRVPANLVAHIFWQDRPGDVRGVTWFHPVIQRLRDFADFTDAQLMRQKIAACFAAFITEDETDTLGIDTENADPYPVESFEPGMISRLRPGESIEFGNPPQVQDFGPYAVATLREVAAGLGISYEAFTGDLSTVNFSSGRMGWLEFQRNIDAWRNHMLMPQLLHRIGQWFLDGAAAQGVNTRGCSIIWTAPRREMISPAQEVPAAIAAIRAGLSSRANEARKLGIESVELDAEIAEDNARADRLGLVFDTDPRRVTQAGNPATRPDTPAPPDGAPQQ